VRGGEKEQKTEREKTAERMMDETLFWRGTEEAGDRRRIENWGSFDVDR
jgi:hypothetical protein